MKEVIREHQVDSSLILGENVAVIGYGNQGHAHALNLRDQGVNVVVGARPGGDSWKQAVVDGFAPLLLEQAVKAADTVMVTLPDEASPDLFKWHIGPHLRPGQLLMFAHGFLVTFCDPDIPEGVDVGLIGPKGAGRWLRSEYLAGRALAALIAVDRDATGTAWERVKSYGWGIGCAKGGLIPTTFREECVTDLFGEQVVLCGGLPELIKAAFETLTARGYSPEAAYLEVCHEVKLIADLFYEGGLTYMRKRISDTAEWGGFTTGPRVINEQSRAAMNSILDEIESGDFAREWVEEQRTGKIRLANYREGERSHAIESVGKEVRRDLPNVDEKE